MPTQSEPVSPPPITKTFLPLADIRSFSSISPETKRFERLKKFIAKYEVVEEKFPELFVTLEEDRDITLKRVSKPGQRIYVKRDDLKPLRSGLGLRIISTSKGVMTTDEAKKQNLGGEILCEIY